MGHGAYFLDCALSLVELWMTALMHLALFD
jgi:hypothetical protein